MERTSQRVFQRDIIRHEQALESCCPHLWAAAARADSPQAWSRAHDQFAAIETYLRHLSVTPIAEAVADLKCIAGQRAASAACEQVAQQTAA